MGVWDVGRGPPGSPHPTSCAGASPLGPGRGRGRHTVGGHSLKASVTGLTRSPLGCPGCFLLAGGSAASGAPELASAEVPTVAASGSRNVCRMDGGEMLFLPPPRLLHGAPRHTGRQNTRTCSHLAATQSFEGHLKGGWPGTAAPSRREQVETRT